MEYGYRNQGGKSSGQSGQSYPALNKSDNPLQAVRDTYRQPQEVAYQMQPGRFMPAEAVRDERQTTSDNRAIVRQGQGYQPGDQNFDLRQTSFNSLDTNYRNRWISDAADSSEGRK